MLKNKISVCLATYNEEKNLRRCLESVKDLTSEIIVVDGFSDDKTREIARSFKAKVFKTSNKSMFHINKQIALDKTTGDWILLLDADEQVTEELKDEIKKIINQKSNDIVGYWIPRKNIIFKKWIKHTGWWPDLQLRLFKNGKVKFPCQSIHENPFLKGKSLNLENHLIHYHYQNISQYLKRLDTYTDNDKKVWLEEGKQLKWFQAISLPSDEFIKRFIVWQGYKDGLHGLALSLLQAFFQFIVFAKVWEEKGFKQENVNLNDAKNMIKKTIKDFNWWQYEERIKIDKLGLKKLYFKLIRLIK